MAARNARVSVAAGGTWVALTSVVVATDISIMLANNRPIMLQATSGTTPPTASTLGPLELLSYGDGWSEATIAEKFPGVTAADYLWARVSDANLGLGAEDAIVGISHAAA
jgi:hypothetical protein